MGEKGPGKIKAYMMPSPAGKLDRSGIATVIRAYARLADRYGIEFVTDSPDVTISHAGIGGKPRFSTTWDVSILHGIYFTAEGGAVSSKWEWRANGHVIKTILGALSVTVPSNWVALTLRREFKIDPYIIEHGVFWDEWQHNRKYKANRVFWGKNRINFDVCDPTSLMLVAQQMPDIEFVTTVAPDNRPNNVKVVGILNEDGIKEAVQSSAVVLSTVKETWGLLYIESMAAGTPVVTVNTGHVPHLSPHGVSGYSYVDGNIDDMETGIRWAIENRSTLSDNARALAKRYTWDKSMLNLRKVLERTMKEKDAYNIAGF